MEQTTIAVDIAKSVFQVAVSSRRGSIETERRLSRDRVLTYFAQQPPAKVLLEACGSAHLSCANILRGWILTKL
jgi:transposase